MSLGSLSIKLTSLLLFVSGIGHLFFSRFVTEYSLAIKPDEEVINNVWDLHFHVGFMVLCMSGFVCALKPTSHALRAVGVGMLVQAGMWVYLWYTGIAQLLAVEVHGGIIAALGLLSFVAAGRAASAEAKSSNATSGSSSGKRARSP